MILVFFALLSYFIGTFPTGIVCAQIFKLGDLRQIGSGNIGATNVLRTGNKRAALVTLVIDALKGTLAVSLCNFLQEVHLYDGILLGAMSFLGHVFPIWSKFKGGKGVATYLGILFGLNPIFGIFGCILWLVGAFLSKISSLGALNMALLMPLLLALAQDNLFIVGGLGSLSLILIFKHRENISRILKRSEPKINL